MMLSRKDPGSALLMATIVVIIVAGIGGAFLTESLFRRNAQFTLNQGDEAQLICDAAMEKVRRGLFIYRRNGNTNQDIINWCNTAPVNTWSSYDIRMDLGTAGIPSSKWASATFQNYFSSTSQSSQAGNDTGIDAPVFGSPDFFLASNRPLAGGAFFAMVTGTPDGKLLVDITATLRSGIQRKVEGVMSYDANTTPGKFPKLAAIVVGGPSTFSGNNTVNGQDFNYDPSNPGTPVLANNPAVPAVMGNGAIGYGGAAKAGGFDPSNPVGTGLAPARGGSAGSLQQNVTDWSALNAPPADGSPTPKNFPASPDSAMQLPDGTLKATAQAQGTYFTSQGAYGAYLAANGGSMPPGAVVYCNFTPSPPFEVGNTINDKSSILVVHNDTGTATMKNIHGNFQGLILADNVDHINSGSLLLGTVFAWGQNGNVFGNGNATVDFSSAALSNLPSLQLQPPVTMSLLSVRKVTP